MLRAEQEKQKRKQSMERIMVRSLIAPTTLMTNKSNLSKEIEGLGRILTGTYAMCAQDTVSSTLAHILITQDGEQFVYLHNFTPLLISQLEDCLDGNEIFCKLRLNKIEKKGKLQLWPDSSANDYIFRAKHLEHYSAFELAMDFEKRYIQHIQGGR